MHFNLEELKKKLLRADYLLGLKQNVFQQSITITHFNDTYVCPSMSMKCNYNTP